MRRVKIVTDSAQDFRPELLESKGIAVVPLTVFFGEESFLDGYEIAGKAFYDKLRTSPHHPHTSQPSPEAFRQKFEELTEDGSSVVAILLSHALSGTVQSANLAKDMLPEKKIEVIDSKLASASYGVVAQIAAEMADGGASFDEIVEKARALCEGCITIFSVDTLDYLARNGRIGRAQHFLGGLLSMKPILSLDKEGYVIALERVRGKSKVIPRVVEIVGERLPSGKALAASISNADASGEASLLRDALCREVQIDKMYEAEIGSIIGTHTGPGAICLQVFPE